MHCERLNPSQLAKEANANREVARKRHHMKRLMLPRRDAIALAAGFAVSASVTAARPARAATSVRFLTNWFAEAEHGGFYQAKAAGLYEKAGLDVTIQM